MTGQSENDLKNARTSQFTAHTSRIVYFFQKACFTMTRQNYSIMYGPTLCIENQYSS